MIQIVIILWVIKQQVWGIVSPSFKWTNANVDI